MLRTRLAAFFAVAALVAGCGSDDDSGSRDAAPETTVAAKGEDLGAIKAYLLEHTEALAASTATLAEQAREYRSLAADAAFDYGALLRSRRADVRESVEAMQAAWREANPRYEEMEAVVAGVPELSEFDVIIDAGADQSHPENAVPLDVKLPSGDVLEQPGNFFFLTESSLFGTNRDFQARSVEPDLDGDG